MDRGQSTLFPERLEDWIGEDDAVRVIDVFVEELDLAELAFSGVDPGATAKPGSAFDTTLPSTPSACKARSALSSGHAAIRTHYVGLAAPLAWQRNG
jgi:hypothetical protein